MAQAYTMDDGGTVPYTPVSAVSAGAVVVIGGRIGVATQAIAASEAGTLAVEGRFKICKDATVFALNDNVFWDAVGDPVGGTADSGAASAAGAGVYAGVCTAAAATGDAYVEVEINEVTARKPTSTAAATGSSQADAVQIGEGLVLVTAGDATKGCLLPAAVAGKEVMVKNGAAAILKVYPASGDVINGLSANAAISLAANVCCTFTAYDSTTWYTSPLLPS